MRAYYEILKISIKHSLVYKLSTSISIFGNIVLLGLQCFLWHALLENTPGVKNSVSINDMYVYQIFGIALSVVYTDYVATDVGNMIKDGSIAMELIKPCNFMIRMFADSMGKTVTSFVTKGLPVIAVGFLYFKPSIHISSPDVMLLILVIFLNLFLYWTLYYIIGLLHFSLLNAGWFARILSDTIRVLGGGLIPLWFFPDFLKKVSLFLPFQLLYQFPLSVFIHKIGRGEIIFNFTLELVWLLGLLLTAYLLWFVGVRKIVIQGG